MRRKWIGLVYMGLLAGCAPRHVSVTPPPATLVCESGWSQADLTCWRYLPTDASDPAKGIKCSRSMRGPEYLTVWLCEQPARKGTNSIAHQRSYDAYDAYVVCMEQAAKPSDCDGVERKLEEAVKAEIAGPAVLEIAYARALVAWKDWSQAPCNADAIMADIREYRLGECCAKREKWKAAYAQYVRLESRVE